ncbi:unnamed protein product [Rhizoctonia solani]|uniref:Uncharacterized protein n=1 Tax=Rhizoctonia solani TaxID=456999 RepID=A0A8H3HV02_9AGAM|nr:unnamed protein product [Rhizoctonia solani]
MGYVLRPIAWQLALVSRLAAPSSNKLITAAKSSHCTQSRFILDFRTKEGQEKVQAWYKYQGAKTRFTHLEYRKVKHGQIKHEFIVVRLSNTTLCRFDRRPQDKERGLVLLDEGAPAEDSVHVLSSFETAYEDLMRETEVLLTINLPRGEDLSFILAVCEAIQTHGEASAYNLMRYNCYFFSWMIVAAVSRSTCDWDTVVVSEDGWGGILQTSFEHVFQGEKKAIPPQRGGIREWFGRTVGKLHLRRKPPSNIGLFGAPSRWAIETFRGALLTAYSNLRGDVQRTLRTLLLRSQLYTALKKELHSMESSGFLSAKLAVTANQVELPRQHTSSMCHGGSYSCRLCQSLTSASRASAEILSAKKHAGGSASNSTREKLWGDAGGYAGRYTWENAWENAWEDAQGDTRRIAARLAERGDIAHPSRWLPSEWDKNIARIQWKNAWDEVDALSVQYTTTVTQTIATTMLAQLTDVGPEQLIFGDNVLQFRKSSGSSKGPPSLQEFIRNRMQDHFEMVDKFGFGSFQELITTAEEAMCEIWIASLEIIDSSHYCT